ncbi:MAG: hypothetical protein Q7T55_00855, partial [Solirubrobacteraceae bacterium]|nr:hypothetical protein [Solirubrobacteraceae bacterium]
MLLLGLLAVGVLLLSISAYTLLAPQAPVAGARTLVVEGWLNAGEIRQAAEVARSGRYERVLTSGGPIEPFDDAGGWKNYATRAAENLRAAGLRVPVIAVPAPETRIDRTHLSALKVREWAQQNGVVLDAFDLYS